MAAAHILVRCPVSGVGSLNGSLLGCFRKDVALCHTASRAWVAEIGTWNVEPGPENGALRETAHFMCTVWMHVRDGVRDGVQDGDCSCTCINIVESWCWVTGVMRVGTFMYVVWMGAF